MKASGPYPEIKLNLICMRFPNDDISIPPELIKIPGVVFPAPSLDSKSAPPLYHIWFQVEPPSSEIITSRASFG